MRTITPDPSSSAPIQGQISKAARQKAGRDGSDPLDRDCPLFQLIIKRWHNPQAGNRHAQRVDDSGLIADTGNPPDHAPRYTVIVNDLGRTAARFAPTKKISAPVGGMKGGLESHFRAFSFYVLLSANLAGFQVLWSTATTICQDEPPAKRSKIATIRPVWAKLWQHSVTSRPHSAANAAIRRQNRSRNGSKLRCPRVAAAKDRSRPPAHVQAWGVQCHRPPPSAPHLARGHASAQTDLPGAPTHPHPRPCA